MQIDFDRQPIHDISQHLELAGNRRDSKVSLLLKTEEEEAEIILRRPAKRPRSKSMHGSELLSGPLSLICRASQRWQE
jgi:hypothetical protein